MPNLHWDHTIHVVNDLDQSIQAFLDQGLYALRGGSHTNWGTYNALSYFGLNYVEFLSVEDRELASKTDDYNVVARDTIAALPDHEIFTRVVIRTDNLDETAKSIASHGLKLSPLTAGKRKNTKGRWIEWRMATVYGDYQGLKYPFFIEWNDSDELRFQDLTDSGAIKEHPAGEVDVDHVVFSVDDPAATAAHWQTVFGLAPADRGNKDEAALAIGDKFFVFRKGAEQRIEEFVFRTPVEGLKGKTFTIGQGTYRFE